MDKKENYPIGGTVDDEPISNEIHSDRPHDPKLVPAISKALC